MPVHPEVLEKINDPQISIDFDALERIAEKYELDLIVLHGSRAQGYAHRNSDADIAVRTVRSDYQQRDPDSEALWYLDLMADINGAIYAPECCDVRVLDASRTVFCMNVACHGMPLYQRYPGSFSEFVEQATRRFRREAPRRQLLRDQQRSEVYGRSVPSDN
ncbi:MAG: hypothetical protein AUJ92_12500 [Armatimonadetes bacterium CG2_30_59_28]|nr:hypothetical protein [Armatimonadota bacterium]OIO93365.1 MAG: hypothetical protein AUJ92_12500 [Armatimonadetes bacterium CG2_30_59_28]PIU65002.1 MAG: hypothetical protein COS85_10435 [Armatimonadetes bacterium CG07_land_8_20_14_0_80_59_28]PIX38176.1 MAG: hypothetical protein COZ56_21205 [Armatimonadetes bacterium CG_4_8_14_3_um_filter_58_9]PIY49172.1 MAG: hypothetical protein COZ05_01090 [Armatimonadetes bacterium CG_4_10_14_3_um_filter_59_10]